MKNKKARFSRPLIGIEGGGYMLLSRANDKVEAGRAIIVNGLVRFLPDDQFPGYQAARGYGRFSGKISYDPILGGGPTVVQFERKRFQVA